jgi:hypothetical protein
MFYRMVFFCVVSWLSLSASGSAAPKPAEGCEQMLCVHEHREVLMCRYQFTRGQHRCQGILEGGACSRYQACLSSRGARCVERCKDRVVCEVACQRSAQRACLRSAPAGCRVAYLRCKMQASKEYKACLQTQYGTLMCCKKGKKKVCETTCQPTKTP